MTLTRKACSILLAFAFLATSTLCAMSAIKPIGGLIGTCDFSFHRARIHVLCIKDRLEVVVNPRPPVTIELPGIWFIGGVLKPTPGCASPSLNLSDAAGQSIKLSMAASDRFLSVFIENAINPRWWLLRVHIWPLTIPLAVCTVFVFYRGPFLQRRRRQRGLCLRCGYDLTGNVSGVCPECGRARPPGQRG